MVVRCFFFIFIFVQSMLLYSPANATTLSNEKRQLIDEMLKINGSGKVVGVMAANLAQQIISILSKKTGSVDANLVELVKSEVKVTMYEDFILNNNSSFGVQNRQ